MHLVYPPKFYITIVSKFLLGIKVVPREIEENGYAIVFFWGGGGWSGGGRVNKVHHGLGEKITVNNCDLFLYFCKLFDPSVQSESKFVRFLLA